MLGRLSVLSARVRARRLFKGFLCANRRHLADNGGEYPPPDLSRLGTADLADLFGDTYDFAAHHGDAGAVGSKLRMQALSPLPRFFDFGGRLEFSGLIETVQCFENNLAMRSALSEAGESRVLVVDAGGSPRAALLGDNLAELALKNGWCGVLLFGFLRDVTCLRTMPLGIKALGAYPVKSGKRTWGIRGVPVRFGGVTFSPGDYLYADEDGVLVSSVDLKALSAAPVAGQKS